MVRYCGQAAIVMATIVPGRTTVPAAGAWLRTVRGEVVGVAATKRGVGVVWAVAAVADVVVVVVLVLVVVVDGGGWVDVVVGGELVVVGVPDE